MEIPIQLQDRGIKFVLLEKSGKKPFQKEWQNKNIEYDDPELLEHLRNKGNYGVGGGGGKNLIIIDFDNENIGISAWIYPLVIGDNVHWILNKGDQFTNPKTTNYSLRLSKSGNLEFLIRNSQNKAVPSAGNWFMVFKRTRHTLCNGF